MGRLTAAGPYFCRDGLAPDALKVEGTRDGSPVTVLTIDRPTIKGPHYALTGQVRYDGVEGTGYLELWNYFPNGGRSLRGRSLSLDR